MKKTIPHSHSTSSGPTTVETVGGRIRITQGSVSIDYCDTEALVFSEAVTEAIVELNPFPTWEHNGVTYDLGKTWRADPNPGFHWRWTGERTPGGVPLMTPHGTEDDGLMDSRVPFDRVLADEKD